MDTAPEEAFDRWAALAAGALRTPFAAVTLFDDHRQYPQERRRDGRLRRPQRAPPEVAICQYVLADGAPLTVEDTGAHPELARLAGPADHGLISYAGTPVTVLGQHVGALCVSQHETRTVDARRHRAAGYGRRGDRVGDRAARLSAEDLRRAQRRRRRPQPHPTS